MTFTYTISVPTSTFGDQEIVALAVVRTAGSVAQIIAKPTHTVQQVSYHSADSNEDFRLSLLELTRVIELNNTRNGTSRTGCYRVDAAGEDRFNPEPSRASTSVVTLTQYHRTDSDRNGKLSLLELTRVIELCNTRAGTSRTGAYYAQSGTEDGFAPGP